MTSQDDISKPYRRMTWIRWGKKNGKNCHVDDSQQIHKYNKVLLTISNKKQKHVSLIKITVGVYKVYTDGIN